MARQVRMSDALDEYRSHLQARGLAGNTLKGQMQPLTRALAEWGNLYVSSITGQHIDKLFRVAKWGPSTRNIYLGYLRGFFTFCRREGYMSRDFEPTDGWRNVKVPNRDRLRIPLDEFPLLLDANQHPRDRMVCALGLYTFMRGGETPDADLVAFMPVNIRAPGTEGELGNRISARLVPMASQTRDPFDRLDMLVANGKALSKTEDADSDFLNEFVNAAGPTVASMAGRLIDAFDLFDHLPPIANVVVSSVPGPSVPLWCAGQQIVRATPLGPLMLNQSLNITLLSYIDTLEFGILACAKKVPDATLLREFLIEEAQMLLAEGGSVAHATSA